MKATDGSSHSPRYQASSSSVAVCHTNWQDKFFFFDIGFPPGGKVTDGHFSTVSDAWVVHPASKPDPNESRSESVSYN